MQQKKSISSQSPKLLNDLASPPTPNLARKLRLLQTNTSLIALIVLRSLQHRIPALGNNHLLSSPLGPSSNLLLHNQPVNPPPLRLETRSSRVVRLCQDVQHDLRGRRLDFLRRFDGRSDPGYACAAAVDDGVVAVPGGSWVRAGGWGRVGCGRRGGCWVENWANGGGGREEDRAFELGSGGAGSLVDGCLLYTYDAADDTIKV